MKLDKLTKEHKKILTKTKKEWLDLSFDKNKEGINKPVFEAGIAWLYQDLLKLKMPEIIYCGSWMSCMIEIVRLEREQQILTPIWKSVRDVIQTSVRRPVNELVKASVDTTVQKKITGEIEMTLGRFIEENIWMPVLNAMRHSVSPIDEPPFTDYSVYNGWENFSWIGKYEFYERIGIFQNNNFTQYKNLNKSNAAAVYEYEGYVFAIQPPIAIERNNNGVLHHMERPAIKFPDGYEYYFVNGVLIPDWIFITGFNESDIAEMKQEDLKAIMYQILKYKGANNKI
jgi:hypothetical protein